jgi:RimJ/RimL family protein N-acetyltransferase
MLMNEPARTQEWIIRHADEQDAKRLLRYLRRIAKEPVNNTAFRQGIMPDTIEDVRAMIRRHTENSNSALFVVDIGRRIIGMVRMTGGHLPFDQHVAELSINVDSYCRGLGIGSEILNHALEWARTQPELKRVQLHVLTRNPGAVPLYEKVGFITEGHLREAYYLYDEGDEDALIMAYYISHTN